MTARLVLTSKRFIPRRLTRIAALAGASLLVGCVSPGAVPRLVHDPHATPAPVVIDQGMVRGVASAAGKAWLGLPYAEPPQGLLRWRSPREASPWRGVRAALRPGHDCVQNLSPGALLGKPGGLFVRGSEDCLVLNVYAPSNAVVGQGWPVMVWLHGGGFSAGTAANYDPTVLAQKQGVIVVTLNYRLGAFGFLAHPALSAEDAAAGSGDYALLDQQAALHWVRENIEAFGGDPRRVTLFGESAGGFSVCHQLAAPGAEGLFTAAIIESGACTASAQNAPREVAEAAGVLMAQDLGCSDPTTVTACLRRAPAGAVARVVSHRRGALGANSWGAVVGTPVLPTTMSEALSSGRFARVPVIIGVNHDEGRLFAYLQRVTGHLWTQTSYDRLLARSYGASAPKIAAAYPATGGRSTALAYGALVTDESFICPALQMAALLENRTPTWLYEFDDPRAATVLPRAPGLPPLGAYHASEVAYILQRPWILANPARFNPAQRALSDRMQDAWGRFARSGDPNGEPARWSRAPAWKLLKPTGDRDSPAIRDPRVCELWAASH